MFSHRKGISVACHSLRFLIPPCCSNDFAHGTYVKRSELWVKHNLFNAFIIYALDSVHEKFDV